MGCQAALRRHDALAAQQHRVAAELDQAAPEVAQRPPLPFGRDRHRAIGGDHAPGDDSALVEEATQIAHPVDEFADTGNDTTFGPTASNVATSHGAQQCTPVSVVAGNAAIALDIRSIASSGGIGKPGCISSANHGSSSTTIWREFGIAAVTGSREW